MTEIAQTECGCGAMINLYKKIGRWEENDAYVPSPGAVVMYDWQDNGVGDNTGAADHTPNGPHAPGNRSGPFVGRCFSVSMQLFSF